MTLNSALNILSGIVEYIGSFVFKTLAVILGHCPRVIRTFIADGCALVFFCSSRSGRRNVRANISAVGDGAGTGVVFSVFRNHCRNLVEMFASSRWDRSFLERIVECEGRNELAAAARGGRGVILATAHIGNWELAALYLAAAGFSLHVVAGIQMNRLLTGAVREAKETRGIEVINPEHSYRRLFQALGGGGCVALLLDGDIYESGVPVTFFGRETILPRGAVQLSRRTGAPVIAGFCRRLKGGKYRIRLEQVLTGEEAASMDETESLGRLYGKLEDFIRENRDQWCIFRPLWRNQH